MKFKKFASLAVSAVMAASLLTGCGGGSTDSGNSGATEAKTEAAADSGSSDDGADAGSETASG